METGGESINSITNTNLYDAVLMDSKRIGHGVNLMMHSGLMNTIKEQKICIECCPVSNQVLRYIDDIRVHPIKIYLNYGIPTVIAPDDPSYFNSFSNDDDFYYAAIGSELGTQTSLNSYRPFSFQCKGAAQTKAAPS